MTHEVFGYATSGSLGDPTIGYKSWNFDLLSTVAFFAIHVASSGVLVADSNWTVWNSSTVTDPTNGLIAVAHAHGVKVVVTIRNPSDMCGALYNGDTTTLQIVNEVVAKGADGVNIDYEGNLATCSNTGQTTQVMLTNFTHQLRVGLDNAKPGYYLSIATYSGSAAGNDGFFNIPALNQYVDSFFVMAYDMDYANQGTGPLTCGKFCMAPVSPLANYYWNDETSMQQYIAAVGGAKTILGQPYYGRVACVSSPTAHAIAASNLTSASYLDASAAISSPDVKPGSYAINRDTYDPYGQNRWDTWYDNRLGCWREMYWSDTTTLAVRYDLVNQYKLRGVGIWTLNYGGGAPELWNTLNAYFVKCASATLTPDTVSQPAGSTVTLSASATQCNSPRFAFWIQYPGGSWHLVQGFAGGAALSWSTVGLAPGVYTVHVWATAQGNGYDAIGSATITLTPCATAAIDPATSTQPLGATVTFTATSTGCPYPRYAYWIQYPDQSWHFVQGFGGPILSWNTTGLAPGDYTVHVWVNTLGNGYDAVGSATVTMTACTTASIDPATLTQDAGTSFNFTASSTGCVSPRYAFWVQYPDASWHLVRGFGGPAFSWSTAGLQPGTYTVHVWVNRAGNGYDAVGSATATLAGCANAALAPASGSATAGTMVTFTPSSTGCAHPRYAFWVQYPDMSWHLVQGFGGTTFNWVTTGLPKGNYTIHVWANTQGNSYDSVGSASFSLT